jgi:hypothetical protein
MKKLLISIASLTLIHSVLAAKSDTMDIGCGQQLLCKNQKCEMDGGAACTPQYFTMEPVEQEIPDGKYVRTRAVINETNPASSRTASCSYTAWKSGPDLKFNSGIHLNLRHSGSGWVRKDSGTYVCPGPSDCLMSADD